ncbi:MAG: ATP synthase F1 subunit epsilon [Candidatus Omnitrophica bacterium]|nr:ATP synthase F1 subunit epsilon [Candidatus Omnitrophota bacterium]
MAKKTIHVKIVTPEKTLFEDEAVSIVAPGALGYLGVLVDHAPLVTSLKEGRLSLRMPDNQEKVFEIHEGVMEVSKNVATILSETVTEAA